MTLHVLIHTAGAVACVRNVYRSADSNQSLSTVSEAIEVVAVHLLEPVPIGDSEPVSVQGRLRVCEHSRFWLEELEASSFVRDIVSNGYRIPFVRLPWPVYKSNHRSALEHQEFVSTAIKELVDSNCVR